MSRLLISLIFSVVVLGLAAGYSIYAEGTYESIGTGDAADGSNDAINFSQGRVWTIDQYGKYIWTTQNRDGTTHWAWSNDEGTDWSQSSEGYSFLTRASVAYDSKNDVLHAIWTATDSNDGIIYRRYGITRDGSNNITAIARINTGVNLQLDTSSSRILEQPVAIWLDDGSTDGVLLAFWTKHGSSLNEARGSMRRLSMTDADGVAGNWVALDGTGDTFSTDPPAVAGDKIYGDTSGASALSAIIRGGSGSHSDDLYVFVAEEDDNSGDQVLGFRATWDSDDSDWSGGWSALGAIGAIGAMDTNSGYSLKYQLITKPVLDTINDRLYVGWARWKDGTNGDTVSIAYLDEDDNVSSTVDVYSALNTHSYAPTLDVAYDETLDDVYISYITSTTNGDNGSILYKTYDGSTLSSATTFYTSPGGTAGEDGSADIPVLFENRSNNRLLFAFRINGQLPPTADDPHEIYWGYETLATATPTPTSTPTPTPSPTSTTQASTPSSQKTSSSNCISGWVHCIDAGPGFSGPSTWQNINGISIYVSSSASTENITFKVSAHNPLFLLNETKLLWSQGVNIVSNIFKIEVLSAFNGYPVEIASPVSVIIPFDKEKLQGVSPYALKFVYFDVLTKRWKVLPGSYFLNGTHSGIVSVIKPKKYMAVGYLASSWGNSSALTNPTISGVKPTFGLCGTDLGGLLLACKI